MSAESLPKSSTEPRFTPIKQETWIKPKRKKTTSRKVCKVKSSKMSPGKQLKLDSFVKRDKVKISDDSETDAKNCKNYQFNTCSYLSPSAKLHDQVPKVEDILRNREETEKYKRMQELIEKSAAQFLQSLQEKKEPKKKSTEKVKILDCKHLSFSNIERRFEKDVQYLDSILYGTTYNERHELFLKDTTDSDIINDLRINESGAVFTEDQLIFIIGLFRERYDNGNRYIYSDYYFKVLLPEYGLKIFMDCYNMSRTDALNYLKSLPVSDIIV